MEELRLGPWPEVTDELVTSWTAVELVLNLHQQLQQSANVSFGYGKTLAEGAYGFASDDQKDALLFLQTRIERTHKLVEWMTLWVLTRTNEEGQWKSDVSGVQPIRNSDDVRKIIDSYLNNQT
jgi:hypothetical protein